MTQRILIARAVVKQELADVRRSQQACREAERVRVAGRANLQHQHEILRGDALNQEHLQRPHCPCLFPTTMLRVSAALHETSFGTRDQRQLHQAMSAKMLKLPRGHPILGPNKPALVPQQTTVPKLMRSMSRPRRALHLQIALN